jgi:repressor LexA
MAYRRELTDRQRQILDYIADEVARRGYPPSVREIGEAVGLSSSSTVHSHLAALEEKGFIRRDPTKPRALEVLDFRSDGEKAAPLPLNVHAVPLVGRVAAGAPILAEENVEETIALPSELADDTNFILKVRGESMVDAGILDGDYVVVKQQDTASNGEIVVALLGEEATVKTFYREPGRIRLQPENETMEPIYATDVAIVGKVVSLFRRL